MNAINLILNWDGYDFDYLNGLKVTMIIGVGIDIVNISRIAKLIARFGEKFEKRIFSNNEINYAAKYDEGNLLMKSRYYAKRYAAKEAFAKAVGLGLGRGINFIDIEVAKDALGRPSIILSEKAKNFLSKKFNKQNLVINLSLSDEPPLAQAIVVISG